MFAWLYWLIMDLIMYLGYLCMRQGTAVLSHDREKIVAEPVDCHPHLASHTFNCSFSSDHEVLACAGSGSAAASPFWVTTGYAGGTGQPAINANPVPGYAAQV